MSFKVGLAKKEMPLFFKGVGMMGYGQAHNLVQEAATPLFCRAVVIQDMQKKYFIFVNLEIAFTTIAIKEDNIPVRAETRGACEILGIDPLYMANEGKLLAVVPPEHADAIVAALRAHPLGADARVIGEVWAEPKGLVFLQTEIGGNRVVDMLVGDPLPRIC